MYQRRAFLSGEIYKLLLVINWLNKSMSPPAYSGKSFNVYNTIKNDDSYLKIVSEKKHGSFTKIIRNHSPELIHLFIIILQIKLLR